MARDRLAAMRAQQAAGSGGYGGSETGAGNNGYGDHLYPTQQTAGVPYNASTGLPQVSDSVNATPVAVYSGQTSYGQGQHGVFQQPNMPASAQGALPQDTYEMQPRNTNVVTSADGLGPATYAGSAPGTQSATSYGSGAQGSTAISMPDGNSGSFFNEISSLQDAIRQIEQNINRISELHSRSLNNVGEASQMEAESQLTGLAQQTSSLTNGVKNRIKALEAEALKIPASGPAPEGIDRNVRLTQIGAAKNRFKETILRYQEVEKAYRTKYRQRTERQLRIVKPDATQDEIQGALDGSMGGQQIFAQALQNSNRQGEARGALREVQERHNDIQRIEQTIVELAALFQEMSILVEQQDEQLNVIKDYAQNTEQEVQAARQQTDKAVVSAKKRRRMRWICFWILGRWGADICPCCDSMTCCNSAWKSDKPLPTDDYRQEAMQYKQNQASQRKLHDEEANVSSGAAYPSATPMTLPVGTAVPMNVPAAGTQQHVAPPTY